MPYPPQMFSLQVGVCSTDNVNYDIRVRDGTGTVQNQTVPRNGNNIGPVVFNPFQFPAGSVCPGTLTVMGVIGAAENAVTLSLIGSNINPCFFGGEYYGPTGFEAEVDVDLVLGGACPDGLPV